MTHPRFPANSSSSSTSNNNNNNNNNNSCPPSSSSSSRSAVVAAAPGSQTNFNHSNHSSNSNDHRLTAGPPGGHGPGPAEGGGAPPMDQQPSYQGHGPSHGSHGGGHGQGQHGQGQSDHQDRNQERNHDINHDIILEGGVEISVHHNNSTLSPYERTSKSSSHNPKMAICREFVLCALATYCNQRDIGSSPACLDALGGTGIAGIQWKKLLGKRAQVTVTDRNPLDLMEANCYRNQLLPKELPIDYTRIPGLPLPHQLVDEIFVQQVSANVIMHLEAFDVIFIDAPGSCSTYLDAAFSNVKNNGMVCFVSSDLSALFAKTGHVAQRNYGASVLKNDYMKEAAVRIVIGAAAKAAAKCNKGIQVLFGVCVEPFVLVVAKVQRGPYYADQSSVKIRPLLQCQICEERTLCPEARAPMENSYDLLPCNCHAENPGQTAIQLGPMWCDNIFDAKFLEAMIANSSEFGFSDKLEAYLCFMYQEAVCSSNPLDNSITTLASSSYCPKEEKSSSHSLNKSSTTSSTSPSTSSSSTLTSSTSTSNITTTNTATTTITDNCQSANVSETPPNGGAAAASSNASASIKSEDSAMPTICNDAVSVTVVSTSTDTQGNKQLVLKMDNKDVRGERHHSSSREEPPTKRMRFNYTEQHPVLSMPPFFYNIHKRKFKGVFLPKLPRMVHLLRLEGFRASRTMFDTYGIRTSANLKQIYQVLLKNCKQETTT